MKEVSSQESEGGAPLVGRIEFLESIPEMVEGDFIQFENLKTDQPWALRSDGFGYAILKRDGRKVFWKTMKSEIALFAEVDGYRLLRQFFRADRLQRPVGMDIVRRRVFYNFLDGALTLWELRLSYIIATAKMTWHDDSERHRALETILDVEFRRNEEILSAYKNSILFSTDDPCDKGTLLLDYMRERTLNHKRLLALSFPTGIPLSRCTIDEHFSYNFFINNREYSSLDVCLSNVNEMLFALAQKNTVLAIGQGDATCANLMINTPKIGTEYCYIDYEFAGVQNPFLDISRSICVDSFFSAVNLDIVSNSLATKTKTSVGDGFHIVVEIYHEKKQIHVTHNYWDSLTASGWDTVGIEIFADKYYNIILPLVRHLDIKYPGYGKNAIPWHRLLGCALFFWCARRTTLRGSPSFLYLNTCLGLELLDFSRWIEEVFQPAEQALSSKILLVGNWKGCDRENIPR